MRERHKQRIWLILGAVTMVTLLHYGTPWNRIFTQELFIRFYYIPIFLGGLWFGLRGGVLVSLLVTLVYLPYVRLCWGQSRAFLGDVILEAVLFNLIGPIIGILADRERAQRARLKEMETLAVLGEAAASLAHEIKNIVIPIRGFLRRIRAACALEGCVAGYLEITEAESKRLEDMTGEMLTFARKAPLRKDEVEVSTLLRDISQCLHDEFQEKGVQLVCHLQDDIIRAQMDRERIRQVLVNLLRNSLDASADGGEVRLIAERMDEAIRIIVQDQGQGIPAAEINRIFHPFYTTKPHGTGLGLAIARRIVKEHDGEIRVQSTVGNGTTISLDLPLKTNLAAS